MRPYLGGKAVGVGLVDLIAVVTGVDVVLIDRARSNVGNERLPQPCLGPRLQRMSGRIPSVVISDHRHTLRIGRPDGEMDPSTAVHFT